MNHPYPEYVYQVMDNKKPYFLDGFHSSGLSRMLNDSETTRAANIIVRTCIVNGKPKPYFESRCRIRPGQELLYYYGDDQKESPFYPWRKLKDSKGKPVNRITKP